MSGSDPQPTAVRRRTRQAVIDAAVHVWARDFNAPLSAVAEEAGVSRSTLHRYFADRPALIDACLEAGLERFGEVQTCPPVASGSTFDQLCAHLEQVVTLGDWVLFIWTDPSRFAGHPLAEHYTGGDEGDPTLALLRAAQAEGDVDPDAPAQWLLGVYYSLLYCAAEAVVAGQMSALDAGRMAVRTLRGGIAAR